MNELNKSIYDTLQAGTAYTALLAGTTSIYHLQAPDNSTLPYTVFSIQAGGDENQTPKRRKNLIMYVRHYSQTSAGNAGSIDTEADTLLHGQTLSVSGWTNFWCNREQDLDMIENEPSGEKVWMSGGFYRMRLELDP